MTEFWVPLSQDSDSVIYGDARIMGDDDDNKEFNLGVGYRKIVTDVPVLGRGVAGVNMWADRRLTERGSTFHQITTGAEWHGDTYDIKANAYIPLDKEKAHNLGTAKSAPYLAGSGIFYDLANSRLVEEAQPGLDLELGFNVSGIVDGFADSARVYAGAYHFEGDKSDSVTGWRTRVAADITPDVQLGARFQRDDQRGSQGFLEATIRFPFGSKQSYRKHGLYARLDESPERDIDIVTGAVTGAAAGDTVQTGLPVLNAVSGDPQRVLYVDNSAAGGGTGGKDDPFNSLAAAQAALADNDVVYVARGDGTKTNMANGFTINRSGVSLIGEGSAFVYDGGKFTTGSADFSGMTLKAAGLAPVITNGAGHGITVTGANTYLAGFTVNGATGDGIRVDANALDLQNFTMRNIASTNNGRMGLTLHGYNNGALTATVESTVTTGNAQHGMVVYDDTSGTFEVDLGGGGRSAGRNVMAGNTLEDLALDYDGRTIAAMNNWWGQASGPDQDAPNVGIRPQIYYGAPMNDGLVGHWTFDTEWMGATTAYDRSGNNNHGTMTGGFTSADLIDDQRRQSLSFDGNDLVTVPDANSLDLPNTLTVIANLMPDYTTAGYASHPVSKWVNTANANFALYHFGATSGGSNPNDYRMYGTASVSGWAAIGRAYDAPSPVWHQYGFTYDSATTSQVYIDGATHNIPQASGGTLSTNNHTLRIGSGFAGDIDDVRIYNRAMTANEMAELYRMNTSSAVNFGGFLTAAP